MSRYEEHALRQVDLLMIFSLGAKQRTQNHFQELLHRADARLQVRGVMKVIVVEGN